MNPQLAHLTTQELVDEIRARQNLPIATELDLMVPRHRLVDDTSQVWVSVYKVSLHDGLYAMYGKEPPIYAKVGDSIKSLYELPKDFQIEIRGWVKLRPKNPEHFSSADELSETLICLKMNPDVVDRAVEQWCSYRNAQPLTEMCHLNGLAIPDWLK